MSLSKENKVIIDGQTYYGGLNQPNLKFIKVNVDCWEKIFDYLSLRDILAMSQTCQRMDKIGGYYYRQNFRGKECYYDNKTHLVTVQQDYPITGEYPIVQVDFLRFINDIEIDDTLEHFCRILKMNLLLSLTTIRLHNVDLNKHQLLGFENIQNNIETIRLVDCNIIDDSVGKFLASCSKLKCLRLDDIQIKSTMAKVSLFQRTYPMLEEFQLMLPDGEVALIPLIPFLERNPSIKYLQIEPIHLPAIPSDTSTIQLDYLDIAGQAIEGNEIHNRLKILHSNGFFKKLRVGFLFCNSYFDWNLFIEEMASFSVLEVWGSDLYSNDVSQMTQLKELYLDSKDNDDDDTIKMAMNLVNLERLEISGAVGLLLPFLCHSKKLKYVVFNDDDEEQNAINLFNLNHLREMAGMQRKVQIGLRENQYLATKWKEKNVSYDLVEITRCETIKHHFYSGF